MKPAPIGVTQLVSIHDAKRKQLAAPKSCRIITRPQVHQISPNTCQIKPHQYAELTGNNAAGQRTGDIVRAAAAVQRKGIIALHLAAIDPDPLHERSAATSISKRCPEVVAKTTVVHRPIMVRLGRVGWKITVVLGRLSRLDLSPGEHLCAAIGVVAAIDSSVRDGARVQAPIGPVHTRTAYIRDAAIIRRSDRWITARNSWRVATKVTAGRAIGKYRRIRSEE